MMFFKEDLKQAKEFNEKMHQCRLKLIKIIEDEEMLLIKLLHNSVGKPVNNLPSKRGGGKK